LMAMAMASLGVPAVSLNALQVPMITNSRYSNAQLKSIGSDRILAELENRKIVIVTGFQGVNKAGDVTTLGRGGSDTTAVALAAALHADVCEIFTDVNGVYTCDPRVVPEASKLSEITYDEMLELSSLGAKVLHNRSVELAKKYGVQLVVRNSMNREEGTVVKEDDGMMEKMLVSGIAIDKDADRISIIGVKDQPGVAFSIFNALAKKNINVDMILQSIGRDGTKDISFTIDDGELGNALEVMETLKKTLGADKIDYEEKVAKVSVVGAGMATHAGVAAKIFEALYNTGINIRMISTSEIRVSVLIDETDADRAARAIHEAFELEGLNR
ncbi:MAG: aspartate kinase, partial [Lachnospiraceae bacterium]|nr:aspartate kinase [Lachnospiraceae bacterium]